MRALRGRWRAAGMLLTAAYFSSMSYGFTCPGSTTIDGCPMGGIGGGNFNFLPGGTYNFTWIKGTADPGAPPLCIAFQKRAATVFSANLQNAGTVTTTFSAYWPTVTEQYASASMIDGIALKCFSPIIMGDGIASGNKNSSLPIAVYKFTITNTDAAAFDTAAIALSNGANATIVRNPAATRVIGITSPTVCVMVDTSKVNAADSITCGSAAADFTADGIMNNASAGILAKRVVVAPSSSRTIYFCVAWTNVANGYYQNYFTDAQALATYGVDKGSDLEAKVDNWHNKILNSNIPDWLKDLVINCMHVFNCMTDWTAPNTYGMVESMSDGLYGTNDQAFHSHFPLALFAPDAAWSQVTRMTSSQYGAGLFGHLYGETGDANVRSDIGQKFVMEVYKDYLWTGNIDKLNALYGNIRGAINGIRSEDANGDGITDDNFLTTYDNPAGDGWVNPSKEYDNEIYLAALKAAVKAAQATGNTVDIATYNAYFAQTSASFETKFWNSTLASCTGRTGYYQNCSNSGAAHGTAIWDAALMGQWCVDVCGLGPLHSETRLESCYNYISDATLDKRNPPCYSLMMANNNVNCSGAAPTGTFYNGGSTPYVSYGAYPAGELCGAFYHNLPDIALRALQAYWNIGYSKIARPFNAACKYDLDGNGVDWGKNRYMNPPACFAALFGITGFTIDVNAKELRISPAQNPLTGGPLMNPISCGAVDYLLSSIGTPSQNLVIKFDNPMQFNTFITKKRGAPATVEVLQPAVGGSPVAAAIAENGSDTSEYVVTFGSTLTIDNAGISINIGPPTLKYTLITEAVNGSISLYPAGGTYGSGTVVTLTATPAAGYAFSRWSGDLTGATNPSPITMDSNKRVTAYFSPVLQYTLATGATNGSVALNPAGGTYNAGTVVTLTATPAAGYAFSSWSGDLTGTTNPAAVTMNANKSVTANFTSIGLPSPWATQDIGSVTPAGSAVWAADSFTVKGSGADIWGTADAFRYVSQPLTSDATIIARVASQTNSNGWAKSGIMFREALTAGAKHVTLVVTPSNGVNLQYRATTGGTSTTVAAGTGITAPIWLKLVHSGSTFTAYRSTDGTNWTQAATLTQTMVSPLYAGLCVCSHLAGTLCTTVFKNVSATITVPNNAPTIATAAKATPNPVTASTTALSVLGADDNGEANLTYTWATTGTPPAAVTFSANGTNAAKSSTATFTKAGSYNFQVTVKDQGNLTVTSATAVTVNQTPTSIVVSPASATVNTSATQQFTAAERDQFGTNLTTQPTFTWSVSGGGTINASGLFTAGTTAGGPYTITAKSGTISGTASVTVTLVSTPVYRLNSGGAASSPFTADQYYTGGTAASTTSAITTTGVTNPAPQAVYQTERYGTFSYTLPGLVAAAQYTVRLHFAEIYFTASGQRTFNVVINGTTVLTNYDIYAATGARYKAIVREFTATADAQGRIVINFNTVVNNAKSSGIEIIRK